MRDKKSIQEELQEFLNNQYKIVDDSLIILDKSTIEKEKYFVFFYNSKKFIETGNMSYALAGNAPIIINKETGEKYVTGTAHPIQYYLDEYEKKHLGKL